MAMNLVDRPGLAGEALELPQRGFGAITSMALHAVVLVAFIAAFRMGPAAELTESAAGLVPQHLVWVPHHDIGGGRAGGGDRSIRPPRRVRLIGDETASVPAAVVQPSTEVSAPPPDQTTPIPAEPMADATAADAGTIDGNLAARSGGRGSTGAGDAVGLDRGSGKGPGHQFGDGATSGGPGVTLPTVIERVSPRYTADAMRARVQGSVWIECVVLPDGSVGDTRLMRSLDRRFGLDEEAIAAAKRWRFRPGQLNNQPVAVIVTIELVFSVR